ncbi:hypothetical protein ES705_43985 [subsurface metagenome]
MIKEFKDLLSWISLQNNCSFTFIDKLQLDFSQNDTYVEIVRKGSIVEKIYDNFTERVLRIRKI